MKPNELLKHCLKNLEGSILVESWGEKWIFYNPGHVLKRGVYILTVKEKDGDNDKGSLNTYQVIDEKNWERAMHCMVFRESVEPAFCVTFEADITNFRRKEYFTGPLGNFGCVK